MAAILAGLVAAGAGAAAAWWGWRDRLDGWAGRSAAAARGVAVAALVLLVVNPRITDRALRSRPLVLLDNSVSMHAAGSDAGAAATFAALQGDTVTFGELRPGEPGAREALADALRGALAGGRRVVVVTDGEVHDTSAMPAELRTEVTVRLRPRSRGADLALTEVRAPSRLVVGDSLWVEVEVLRTRDAPDSVALEVRSDDRVLLQGVARFAGAERVRIRLAAALPTGFSGAHWLEVMRVGPADAEPGDDIRWWRVVVSPTPGIVVIATSPDWDSRFLYRTLTEVVEAPVRGYLQLAPGSWRRMDNLHLVSVAEVNSAARTADLLAVRGSVASWEGVGRARLLWAPAEVSGDWYVSPGAASPVAGAFSGASLDSLPPASAVTALDVPDGTGWVGATARLARRGAEVPVMVGRDGNGGRTVTLGADGLYRWAFRGGVSEQLWRGLIAGAATWLLAAPGADGARAVPVLAVTQRGRPVRFRWTAEMPATSVPLRLERDGAALVDTLRFDGRGEATLALGVGRYGYQLEGGGSGHFAVEPFSDELLPAAVTLTEHVATASPAPWLRSLREAWWLFALAIMGFMIEWSLRRRFGMR